MNRAIRRKLIKAKTQPSLIKQWFRRAIVLDCNWKEKRREEKRLKEKRKNNRVPAPRPNN